MPFVSSKQRKYLWANKPKVARKFAEHDNRISGHTDPVAKKAIKKLGKKLKTKKLC